MTKPFYQWTSQEVIDHLRRLDRKTRVKLIGFSIAGVLFLAFIVWPAWFVRPQVRGQIQTLRSQIQLGQAKIFQEPKLITEQKEHEDAVAQVRSRLAVEGEGGRVVGILAGLAEKSEVNLLSVEPQTEGVGSESGFPPPFDAQYFKTSYLVKVEGGYQPLLELINQLEHHGNIFRVSELSIASREETPRIHSASILISTFSLRQKPLESPE